MSASDVMPYDRPPNNQPPLTPDEIGGGELTTKEERYLALADTVASTVIEKQKAYGDAFGRSGAVMRTLYPDGIPPSKLDDALTVVRIVDKLFRIAADRDALGESPFMDIMGYGLLAMQRVEAQKLEDKNGSR